MDLVRDYVDSIQLAFPERNLRFQIEKPIPIQPSSDALAADGDWNGFILAHGIVDNGRFPSPLFNNTAQLHGFLI